MKCKYCKHYCYYKTVFEWGQNRKNGTTVGRCLAELHREHGNMTFAEYDSDCENYEIRKMKYAVGTVFVTDRGHAIAVSTIHIDYAPRLYRMAFPQGGKQSMTEDELDRLRLIWKPEEKECE